MKTNSETIWFRGVKALFCPFILLPFCLLAASCNDWLDVQDSTRQKEEDFYAKKSGFKDALTGCYMTMADRDIYGESMTMSSIESLANQWYLDSYQYLPEQYYLQKHDYGNDYVKDEIQKMYAKLFNVVTQANVIIKNVQTNGAALADDPQLKGVIEGEAYAIRAFCQLDVLRLFGQMPHGSVMQVSLPYCETTAIDEIPPYYTFAGYVGKLESDISRALELLGRHDPVMQYSFSALDNVGANSIAPDDDYFYYRRSRLNYWAVKALQARMYLYVGETEKAHGIAMEIINARNPEGEQVLPLSGLNDIDNERWACPGECLFFLSKYDLHDYAEELLYGDKDDNFLEGKILVISQDMLQQMYLGVNISSHNRYRIWNRSARTVTGVMYAATKKYYWDTGSSDNLMLGHQIIPMLRMSEVYLIAMETSNDLMEVNSLYDTYMRSHNVLVNDGGFASLDEMREEMVNEYRREFFAEGQMFYTYKRMAAKNIMWYTPEMTESEYIIPLPDTEYNSNLKTEK